MGGKCGKRDRLGTRPGFRARSGQQLREHQAECVDVGCGRDRLSLELFGRRIVRRQRAIPRCGSGAADVERRGDAEIEQFHQTVGGYQDIRWLQVAVHDQTLMRVLHGGQHLQHQAQSLADGKAPRVAIGIDALAFDQFHRQIRRAVTADSAVEQHGDIRMAQGSQDLALAAEALACSLRIHADADQLERGVLRVRAVGARGTIHRAHAAATEDLDNAPVADVAADQRIAIGLYRAGNLHEWPIEHTHLRIGRQQAFKLAAQRRIVDACE